MSGSTLFATILNSSVMLGNYLQQTTSADGISRFFFLGAFRVKMQTVLIFSSNNMRSALLGIHLCTCFHENGICILWLCAMALI